MAKMFEATCQLNLKLTLRMELPNYSDEILSRYINLARGLHAVCDTQTFSECRDDQCILGGIARLTPDQLRSIFQELDRRDAKNNNPLLA